jgi:hypothetical protein
VSHSFGYIPKSGIVGSYGRSMFRFLRSLQQHLLLVVLLMRGILTGVRWNISVVIICIFFMVRGGEPFFMCFLAI